MSVASHKYAINCGGGSSWQADDNYAPDGKSRQGATYTPGTPPTIDVGTYTDAPSQAVLQSQRTGQSSDTDHAFYYEPDGLPVSSLVTMTCWFAEVYWSTSGQRVFNIADWDTSSSSYVDLESDFDIYAVAGAANKLVKKTYSVRTDGTGKASVRFYLPPGGVDNPCIQAIAFD
jgi:hypothetical protein